MFHDVLMTFDRRMSDTIIKSSYTTKPPHSTNITQTLLRSSTAILINYTVDSTAAVDMTVAFIMEHHVRVCRSLLLVPHLNYIPASLFLPLEPTSSNYLYIPIYLYIYIINQLFIHPISRPRERWPIIYKRK